MRKWDILPHAATGKQHVEYYYHHFYFYPYDCCSKTLLFAWFIRQWHLCMLLVACSHVDELNRALGIKCHSHHKNNNNTGFMRARFITRHQRLCLLFEHQGHSSSRSEVNAAACAGSAGPPVLVPRSAPRFIPQNGAGYLRVVLGEEVGPVRRRGDAYDKYSLDCEETENTVRLRADRHFPLNIQETGINKRRTGRTVSRRWAKNNRAPEKVFGGSWWLAEASGHFSRQWNLKQRRAERIGSWRPGRSGSGRCCAAAADVPACLFAHSLSSLPLRRRTFAPFLSHSLQCYIHTAKLANTGIECFNLGFQNKTIYCL